MSQMTMTTDGAPQAPAGQTRLDVENTSTIGQFLWIGFYTTIFTALTLTLYRFWARTIVRKRLWADTTIGGEPLEYTGRGMELFIGFLIAIFTVMLPLVGALLAAQFLLQPPWTFVVIGLVYVFLFVLIGAAIFLARRYQLSRTTWRGVRFEQRGSPWGYAFATIGYSLLSFITLGWFAPAMRLRLEKKLWNNTFFGDMPFAYDNSKEARTEKVYVSYVLSYFGVIIFYAIMIGAYFAFGLADMAQDPDALPDFGKIGMFYLAFFGGIFVLILFVAWHEAVMIRQITKSISLGDVKLASRFNAWDIIELAITNTLLTIFTLGFGAMAAQMRVWRRVCRKLDVDGTLDLAAIHQAASRGPKSGEGMVDAFDLSGGV
jgi:uncharacterized membrane protein YjgN (DUF898 family)